MVPLGADVQVIPLRFLHLISKGPPTSGTRDPRRGGSHVKITRKVAAIRPVPLSGSVTVSFCLVLTSTLGTAQCEDAATSLALLSNASVFWQFHSPGGQEEETKGAKIQLL